ncbi:MAG: chromate resistance protein ChrB domain-containing protein [Gemmatimonadales bacterium]
MISSQEAPWLLLIHQIPPKPDYFRVKVRRRLRRIGARPLKNSVYVLPRSEEALEDFQWLAREIVADGGEATVCEASFLEGISDQELLAMFETTSDDRAAPRPIDPASLGGGRTWVTRQGVKVDRVASAWLIRRFIDPAARFKFVPPRGYQPEAGELRFDMYQAEFTHEGDGCTFETLLARFGLRDAALRAIGELVHDVDCKDAKFGRPEAPGLASLVDGIARGHDDDAQRIERAAPLFDDLYAHFHAGA